jgi:hypothetical protein
MTKIAVFSIQVALGLAIAMLPSLCLAADFQYATLRLASSEGVGLLRANGSTAKGAVILAHTELVNYGNTVQVVDPTTNLPVNQRNRLVAVDYCLGGGAQGGGTGTTTIIVPMGLCLVGYDMVSLGGHYDFANRAMMATISVNLMNLPPGMAPLLNTISAAVMGEFSTPVTVPTSVGVTP